VTNATDQAKGSSALSTLQAVRSQLELARNQHGGYPDLSSGWTPMTTATEADPSYSSGDSSGNEVGPYLEQAPVNPINKSSAIGTGWSYNQVSGQIKLLLTSDQASQFGIDASDFDTDGDPTN